MNRNLRAGLFFVLLTLLSVSSAVGCAGRAAPAKRQAATRLTDEQRELNVKSFDQVWTTIRDQHWDPTLGGLDWNAVRDELRPKVQNARTMGEARGAMSDMIERLHQSHFAIIPAEVYHEVAPEKQDASSTQQVSGSMPKSDRGAPGFDVRVIDGQAVVTRVWPDTPAARAGVKTGWVVTKIGKRDVAPVLKKVEASYANSSLRDAYLRAAVMGAMGGNIGEAIEVTFLDAQDRKVKQKLTLGPPPGVQAPKLGNVPVFFVVFDAKKLEPNIGYIALSAFFDPQRVMTEFGRAMSEFHSADGIILDLRGNPGGIGGMAMGISGYFLDKPGQKLGTMVQRSGPLNFVVNARPQTYDGPLAILVDGASASTSEILAAGLKDLGRARVFGTKTPGMALPSVVAKLPNGDGFQYAVANYTSAGGAPLEGRGVTPDEVVTLDRASLLAGRDPVIDAAVRWIESQKSSRRS
jgi:carboxyl-terminal processing protease